MLRKWPSASPNKPTAPCGRALAGMLADRGKRTGLSKFVEEAVRWRIFEKTVREACAGFAGRKFDGMGGIPHRKRSTPCHTLNRDGNGGFVSVEDGAVPQSDLHQFAERSGEELLDLLVFACP